MSRNFAAGDAAGNAAVTSAAVTNPAVSNFSPTVSALTVAAAVGCAAMGGVFFAFSAFVMAGLGRLPAAQATAAMQSINITAVRPAFMTGLFGTALVCAIVAVRAVTAWDGRRSTLLVIGAGLYLVGVIGLTIAYHVPLNDDLGRLDPNAADTAARWSDYLSNWTRWNHVRAAAGIGAAVAFVAALLD